MRDPRIPPFEPVFQTLERQSPRVLVRSRGLVVVAGARNYLQTKRRFEVTTEDPAPTTARAFSETYLNAADVLRAMLERCA